MVSRRAERDLAPSYSVRIDGVDEPTWNACLAAFDDANLYQTWAYGAVRSGERNVGHVRVLRGNVVVAAAQARIARVPGTRLGIAHVRWGPVWRRSDGAGAETFRQAIRALRNEFACRRGLVLRLIPRAFEPSDGLERILAEEGFVRRPGARRERTMLVDLRPPLDELRKGLLPRWRRDLNRAERQSLEIVEGADPRLLDAFIEIYRETVSRKRFAPSNDIEEYRAIQRRLPEPWKLRIMLCRSGGRLCAGLVASAVGRTGVYLFGATSNEGLRAGGSFALQWSLLGWLKSHGATTYDLHGVDPERNPGTYRFKRGVCGRNGSEVDFLGTYEADGSVLSSVVVGGGDALRRAFEAIGRWRAGGRRAEPPPPDDAGEDAGEPPRAEDGKTAEVPVSAGRPSRRPAAAPY